MAERIIAIVLFLFSMLYIIATLNLPKVMTSTIGIGPKAFPLLVASVLALLSLVLLLKSFSSVQPNGEKKTSESRTKNLVFVTFALFVYIFVLRFTGYVLSTFLFLVTVMMVWNRGKRFLNFAIPAVFSIGAYFLISALKMSLPKGLFGLP